MRSVWLWSSYHLLLPPYTGSLSSLAFSTPLSPRVTHLTLLSLLHLSSSVNVLYGVALNALLSYTHSIRKTYSHLMLQLLPICPLWPLICDSGSYLLQSFQSQQSQYLLDITSWLSHRSPHLSMSIHPVTLKIYFSYCCCCHKFVQQILYILSPKSFMNLSPSLCPC